MLDKEKLNKVGLDYISLKVSRGRNNIYCIDSNIEDTINFQESNEKYVINIWIDIIGIKKDSDEEIEIGKLEGNGVRIDIWTHFMREV